MKIVELTIEDFMRIKAVHIEPDGSLVVIGGKNGVGKSSALKAVGAALGGKRLVPEKPIREGAETAKIEVTLDAHKVTRRFKRDIHGEVVSTIKVEARDGEVQYGRPQELLGELYNSLTFDPLTFVGMDPAGRLAMLKELLALDFTAEDARRAALYSNRTGVNAEAKRLTMKLAEMPRHDVSEDDRPPAHDLAKKLADATAHNADVQTRVNTVDALESAANELSLEIGDFQGQIEELEAAIKAHQEALKDGAASIAEHKEWLADNPPGDTAELAAEIESNQAATELFNDQMAENAQRDALASDLRFAHGEAGDFTAAIAKIDESKKAAIAKAEMPVEGLGLGEDGVTFNGLPFAQASAAEQLRVSVAMGLALNPKLRVMLVHNGSLLDEDNLRMIAEMAEAADAQVWVERVSDNGKGCSFVIEDGRLASDGA